MDDPYIKIKGVRKYPYRAVDKEDKTVDVLLAAHRDVAAARRFFAKAKRENHAPTRIAMDKSGANKAAIDDINSSAVGPISVREVKYLNNTI
jgi:transposase-like protein